MMKNKFEWYLLAFFSFIESLSVFITNKSLVKTINYKIKENNYSFEYGLFILCISFIFFYIGYKKHKTNTPQYTICPNCKETFNYDDLKKGKCPYCKDVDTVDIEQYYKEHPEKLEV